MGGLTSQQQHLKKIYLFSQLFLHILLYQVKNLHSEALEQSFLSPSRIYVFLIIHLFSTLYAFFIVQTINNWYISKVARNGSCTSSLPSFPYLYLVMYFISHRLLPSLKLFPFPHPARSSRTTDCSLSYPHNPPCWIFSNNVQTVAFQYRR